MQRAAPPSPPPPPPPLAADASPDEEGRGPSAAATATKPDAGAEDGRRLGATIIPLRVGRGGRMEVLCTQSNVVNFLKSEPGQPRKTMSFPGEFRFLGALRKPEVDVTPLDTAIRGLTSVGWMNAQRYIRSYVAAREQLGRAAMQALLFDITGPGMSIEGPTKTFHFVCTMAAGEATDHFVDQLNELLEVQHAYCDAKGDELFQIPEAMRAPLCPMFRRVAWWSIDEILDRYEDEFVNAYQREEFVKHGLQERRLQNSHMQVLRLLKLMSVEQAFDYASSLEHTLRSMSPADLLGSPYSELEHTVRGLQVLSFNLNILPFGVVYWTSVIGSGHGFKRLRRFLNRIRKELDEEGLATPSSTHSAGSSSPRRRSKGYSSSPSEVRALDVIAVQELFASPFVPGCCAQTRAVREMAALGYTAVTGDRVRLPDLVRRGKWTDSGLVIFSRLKVVHSSTLRFTAGTAMDAGACKGAIWARLALAEGRYLDVFNCHLQASHTGPDSEVFDRIRRSQLLELREFVKLAGSEHPLLLTGDFNVDAIPEPPDPMGTYGFSFRPPRHESEDYQRMLQLLDPNGRFVDLLAGPTDDDPLGGGTTPSARRHPCTRPPRLQMPSSAGYVARHKYPQRLDYVFYRPTLTSLVEHSATHVEEFMVHDSSEFAHLSDHYGIRARFRLRCSVAWASSSPPAAPSCAASSSSSAAAAAACAAGSSSGRPSRSFDASPAAAAAPAKAAGRASLAAAAALLGGGTAAGWCWWIWLRHRRPPRGGGPLAIATLAGFSWVAWWRGHRRQARLPSQGDCRGVGAGAGGAGGGASASCRARRPEATRTVASSPYDTFVGSVDSYGGRRCIGSRVVRPDGTLGEYTWLTYRDAQREVLRISSGLLRKFQLKRNARVGLLGDASAEWLLCDIALMRCGFDIVCLAAHAGSMEATSHSLRDLELLICSENWLEYFVDSLTESETPECPIVTLRPALPRLAARADHKGLEVLDLEFIAHLGEVKGWVPDLGVAGWEVFTTMYRSRTGSRSELAGVSVSLQGLTMAAHSMADALGLCCEDVHFGYSWPAFAAERVVLHAMLASGGAVGFFGGTRSPRIFDDIKRLRPTFLLGTPSLFRRQITRLLNKHIGAWGHACFNIHRWALLHGGPFAGRVSGAEEGEGSGEEGGGAGGGGGSGGGSAVARGARRLRKALARLCLQDPVDSWLKRPFLSAGAVLVGPRTRLRFVLALCTAGNTALPLPRCLTMRLVFGCPVLKGFVAVEGGGLVTLGEAPYFGDSTAQAFAVGQELPGIQVELLPLEIPLKEPLSILQSSATGIQHGTMRIRGQISEIDARVGFVCGRRGQELFVFGRLFSLEASRKGPALCEALEQLLVQLSGAWLMQLLLTARRSQGVVGIAVVRTEELWRLMRFHRVTVPAGEDLCKDPRVRALCLYELQVCARSAGLSEAEWPRALYLQPTHFSLEAGLQTPTFALRRDQLLPRFAGVLEQLFKELGEGASAAAAARREPGGAEALSLPVLPRGLIPQEPPAGGGGGSPGEGGGGGGGGGGWCYFGPLTGRSTRHGSQLQSFPSGEWG